MVTKHINLFGELQEFDNPKRVKGYYKQWRNSSAYRKQNVNNGKSCSTCKYIFARYHHDKKYFKCKLQGGSYCESSDIRLSYVCNKYEKGELTPDHKEER